MKIVTENAVDDVSWRRLMSEDPAASFFHEPAFLDALVRFYPHFDPFYLLAHDDAGGILGGLPAVRIRQAGLSQILSLPFGSYGTPLSVGDDPDERDRVRRELTRHWLEEAGRSGVVRANLVPFYPPDDDPAADQFPSSWIVPERTHLVSLAEGFEDIWFNRYDKENRTASRKATRAGVVVVEESNAAGADVLDGLYRPQSQEWTGHTPYRYGLFRHLVESSPDHVRIWVARRGDDPVFSCMTFYHKEIVTPWVSGSSPEARALCAGNLIHKVMIEDACRRGFSVYNFGGSGGVAGIEAFKVAFGGIPVDYNSYFHEAGWFGRVRNLRRRVRKALGGSE